jgi:hypothetical protein
MGVQGRRRSGYWRWKKELVLVGGDGGWKEENGRRWCLGQAFLTKSSLGAESAGRQKSEQEGAARLLERGEARRRRQAGGRCRPSLAPIKSGRVRQREGSVDTHS